MKLELHGIELHGFHGANEEERADGQTFLFDVEVEIPEPARDELGATIDYRALRDCVREVSDARARTCCSSRSPPRRPTRSSSGSASCT